MTKQALKYCARAVVRYLDGDMDLFDKYVQMALMIHEKETSIATVGELVPERTKQKLYEMVS